MVLHNTQLLSLVIISQCSVSITLIIWIFHVSKAKICPFIPGSALLVHVFLIKRHPASPDPRNRWSLKKNSLFGDSTMPLLVAIVDYNFSCWEMNLGHGSPKS